MTASQAGAFSWRYLRPSRRAFFGMAVCVLVASVLIVLGPAVLGSFVNGVEAKAASSVLVGTAVLFLAITAAAQATLAFGATLAARVAWDATNALRRDLARHVLGLDAAFHRSHQSGELIQRIDADVGALAGLFSRMTVEVGGNGLLIVGVVVAMTLLQPALGVVFAVLIALTLATLAVMGQRSTVLFEEERETEARYFGDLGESLSGAEGLWAMGAQGFIAQRLASRLDSWKRAYVRAGVRGYVIWAVALGAFVVGDVIAYGLTGGQYLIGRVPLGTVYAAVAYAALLSGPLDTVRRHFDDFQSAAASLRRVSALFSERGHRGEEAVALPPGPLPVELQHVSFAYPDDPSAVVLHDVSITLQAGSHLALLGRTGAGKTSVGRIVLRLETPTAGTVQVGGVDLSLVGEASLRQRCAYVGQEVRIFAGTLKDNLALFDHRVEDARLNQALEDLGMATWALKRGGLLAAVSAHSLSAGEAQLIAVARAFVRDPGLVVLDEPFARVEARTRAVLERALTRLVEGRTAIIIVHRLATRALADQVMVLEAGQVVEQGSMSELLRRGGGHLSRVLGKGLAKTP